VGSNSCPACLLRGQVQCVKSIPSFTSIAPPSISVSVLITSGSNNTNLATLTYQTGPLGKYYQPTNSVLINAGSRTADLASLYQFTATTNQVKETNSTVDIGLHYVAVNAQGQPIDTDGDGIPDYQEDANGNGTVTSGETDWQNATDLGLKVIITKPKNNSLIP